MRKRKSNNRRIVTFKQIKPGNKRNRKFWVSLFGVLGLVVGLQLIASNLLAGRGQELSELEAKIASTQKANDTLRLELSSKTSLSSISTEAEKSGLAEPSQVIYVNSTDGFAAMAR